MNIEIRYFSQTGNTRKLADAIGEELGIPAKTITKPIEQETDLLFLGSALYAFTIASELKEFIKTLNPSTVKKVAVFSSAAMFDSAYKQTKKELEKQGLTVLPQEFHCYGEFKFARKGHPTPEDLKRAKEFAKEITRTYQADVS